MDSGGVLRCDLCGAENIGTVVPATWSMIQVPVTIDQASGAWKYEQRHVCVECVRAIVNGCNIRIP